MARHVTFQTLIEDTRRWANIRTSTPDDAHQTDSDVARILELKLAELHEMLTSSTASAFVETEADVSIVNGAGDLPEDFFRLNAAWVVWSSSDHEPLTNLSNQQYAASYAGSSWTAGASKAFRIVGSQLRVFPAATSATVRIAYVPAFATADEYDGVNGWEKYVTVGAAIEILAIENRTNAALEREYERQSERILSMIEERQAQDPPRIRDASCPEPSRSCGGGGTGGGGTTVPISVAASAVTYSPTAAALQSTNVQGALDELGGYATMALLRAVAPVNGKQARTRTYATDGDGGGGLWRGVVTAPLTPGTYTHNGGTVLVPFGGDGSAAWLREYTGPVMPQWFGGRPDSGEPTSATQAAIDCVQAAGGGAVYFSAGTWNFPCTTSLDPGSLNIAFVGDGKESTIFQIAEGTTGNELYLFSNVTTTRKGDLRFEGIRFQGTLAADERDNFGNPLYLDYYSHVRIVDCAFDDIAGPAMDFHSLLSFRAVDCDLLNLGRDGLRVRDTPDCVAVGCHFLRGGDDAIAFHTANYEVEADVAAGIPIRERMIVSSCTFANTGTIKLLGAKKAIVSGNTMHLMHLWAVQVACQSSSEGTNPMHDVSILDNIITDTVGTTAPDAHISVELLEPRGAAATSNAAPMRYDSTAVAIVRPWDWYQSIAGDTDYAWPPVSGLTIKGNTCRRTMKAAAAFSDYGCGDRLDQGIATDPAVTDAKLLVGAAVRISGPTGIAGMKIEGNTFEHMGTGLTMPADSDDQLGLINCSISSNTFHDFTGYGVLLTPVTSGVYVDLKVENNTFSGDFYRRASNSNLDGTYDANGTPTGVEFGATKGAVAKGNRFSNVCNMVNASTLADHIIENNVAILGTPVAMAFNTGNKGIGVPRADASAYRYIIADSDPTSATYRQVSSIMARTASAMPSSGWYYAGWLVDSTAPTTNGARGWLRLTTGSNHVEGVDWLVLETAQTFTSHRKIAKLYDDFTGDALASNWNGIAGTSATVPAILANSTNGRVRLAMGNNASADMAANGSQLTADTNWLPSQGGLIFEARLVIDTATSIALFIGFTDQATSLEMPFTLGASDTLTSNATDGVGFLFDTAADTDNIWLVGVAADADATKQNSALAFASGVFRTVRVEVSSAGAATFYIDGVAVGTAMTAATSTGVRLTPVVAGFSRSASARNVDVDFIYVGSAR